MNNMRTAYFYGGKDIRVVEEAVPTPGPGEVLFKVMAAGVCGSDLHNYRGYATMFHGNKATNWQAKLPDSEKVWAGSR
jgi:threonine dehydrogenase-like Zn-dependent dehydrogenase